MGAFILLCPAYEFVVGIINLRLRAPITTNLIYKCIRADQVRLRAPDIMRECLAEGEPARGVSKLFI